jgi:hypothetical protein
MQIQVTTDTDTGNVTLRAETREIIQAVKSAPPALRRYDPATKLWTLSRNAWPAVHQLLVDKGHAVELHGRLVADKPARQSLSTASVIAPDID